MIKDGITLIKYGESVLPENIVFLDGDSNKLVHIDFLLYLIKVDDKLILVDAGCETMPGFIMKNHIGTQKALKNIGIECSDITDVIITHSHHDHIECVGFFENAIIHIQKDEYERGRKYLGNNKYIHIFKDEKVLYEDIKIIKIGGHSKGSCIVEVAIGDEIYVITGDECYSRENIIRRIPTGATICLEKSKMFIEKYSEQKYKILLAHDR